MLIPSLRFMSEITLIMMSPFVVGQIVERARRLVSVEVCDFGGQFQSPDPSGVSYFL
jgi:predicted Na+-dependent transporter